MESNGIRSRGRGRKRMRGGSEDLDRWNLVGRHVRKEFEGIGVFSGKIVRYKRGGLYRVNYEDGDCEDLEYEEIRGILVDEAGGGNDANAEVVAAKEKLDQSVEVVAGKEKLEQSISVTGKSGEGSDRCGESQAVSKVSSDEDAGSDADSSSVSGKSENPPIQPLALPPSSGSIGVPEESVSFLFSVYNFLRSFSHLLFLSPFSLEDFVGALNHGSPNSLLDAVHVSLLRALRQHLEVISNDSSSGELALKCLRCLDWSLLDTLTWVIYIIEYLHIMGYTKGKDWKGFHDHVLRREYYSLPVHVKLRILQFLCDDLLEFAELRTEINMRESADGANIDDNGMLASESGPRRVHPRYSKTSACKDAETIENIVEPDKSKLSHNNSVEDSIKLIELEANASDDVDDGNSDECKLCGMDGTLLCCDGCPYAYHPRCIGLTKASIPEGQWFCPECVVNKMGPACSRIGRGLRGAEVFGIDPCGRLFLGTCNYVLVLETSTNTEPVCRHYCQNDVLQLLRVLCSSAHHALLYSQICKGILQYYEISEDAISLHSGGNKPETKQLDGKKGTEPEINPLDGNEGAAYTKFSIKESHIPLDTIEQENCTSNASESNIDNGVNGVTPSCRENEYNEAVVNDPTLDSCKGGFLSQRNGVPFAPEYAKSTAQQLCSITNAKIHEQLGTESMISLGSQILPAEHSDLNHQSSGDRSIVLEFATCASREADSTGQDGNSMVLCTKNGILSTYLENRLENSSDGSHTSFVATSFKPQGYINQYILGDIAASAAANLAVLASENIKASEALSSCNQKKATSGDVALQIKAFSGAALHFQWPSSDKKLMDVPRERCGWCIACKFAGTNKRGCLLNLAASNALKGDPNFIGGVRPMKNSEGPFPAIAAFILNMEESLRGLIVGPLLNLSYRRQWRKRLEQSFTCNSLKYLLLDLEENIHLLAFSGSWVKPVDDWSFKLATAQFGTYNVGLVQKRGPSTRRGRKQSTTSEIKADTDWKQLHWWRGGKLSKLVFQIGILPRSMHKKAARQGGSKKLSGIHYEGSEIPRKSRRLSWRAAVEMSKNASQLALQVRCLDAHLRWSDIVRPELNSQDGKGLDIETSAFRNAYICDKKIVESKIRYALAFGYQKHLPSRVMKNVIEVELSQNGRERFWFSENHIPLYLIKNFGKSEKSSFPQSKNASLFSSKIPRRQLKTCRRDIFSYLIHRDDASSCALCQQDVLFRNAVKCDTCQGYCHKDCTIPLTAEVNDKLEFMCICKQCYNTRSAITNKNFDARPKIHLSMQEREQIALGSKIMQQNRCPHMQSMGNVDSASKKKSSNIRGVSVVSRKGSSSTYGLIWKKKNDESDSGTDFRLRNILLRGNEAMDPSQRPVCHLCSVPYDSNLMYIRCENCKFWYHADAVQLKEDDIFRLEGFKCCRCRRKVSPICPYASEEKKLRMKTPRKQVAMERNETGMMRVVPGYVVENPELEELTTPVLHANAEHVATEEFDPLLFSLENVELIAEPMLEINSELDTTPVLYPNSQKLPVRRYVKNEKDSEGSLAYLAHEDPESLGLADVKKEILSQAEWEGDVKNELFSQAEWEADVKEEILSQAEWEADVKEEILSQAEWDFPIGGELSDFQGGGTEEMEYEPQTYFSFTELLATGDDRMDELFDTPVDVPGNWGNSSGFDDMGNVGQAMPSSGSFETFDMGMVNNMQEFPAAEPTANPVQCGMCGHFEPAPDHLCEICNLQIHSHCSPWEEPAASDHRWRCGRCRDWR